MFSASGPNRSHSTVPYRTAPHHSVRSWFAVGTLMVLSRYGTVTVRYFNFFMSGTVHEVINDMYTTGEELTACVMDISGAH